jgi:hypothetical protein
VKRVLAIVAIMVLCVVGASIALALDAGQVRTTIKRVGDWQLAHSGEFGIPAPS